ncbi:hypothetical protein QYM36_010750, partial [Artemia franciscana]
MLGAKSEAFGKKINKRTVDLVAEWACSVKRFKLSDCLPDDYMRRCPSQKMHHPIQMKPADSENRNERKLFVGMLSKKYNENDVRHMFSAFGAIEECTVLRDTSGVSKGCAFVTFASKQSAVNAIKAMHQSTTMEGCSSPLVVKFADTQKEKDQKRINQLIGLWPLGGLAVSPQYISSLLGGVQPGGISPTNITALQNYHQLGGLGALSMQQILAAAAGQASYTPTSTAVPMGIQQQVNPVAGSPQGATTIADLTGASFQTFPAFSTSDVNALGMQNLATLSAISNAQHFGGINAGLSGMGRPTAAVATPLATPFVSFPPNAVGYDAITAAYAGLQQYPAYPAAFTTYAQPTSPGSPIPSVSGSSSSKQIEGPEGANVFIYHLPQEFSDNDLCQAFLPFGNILSAKVFVDKQTSLSKCF